MDIKLTQSQQHKASQLIRATQFVFSNPNFGVQNLSFNKYWVVGDVLRNLLLQDNPYMHNYSYYLQLFNQEEMYCWVEEFKTHNIPYLLTENKIPNALFFKDVWATLNFSLLEFGIDCEFEVFIGAQKPENFIEKSFPINVSQIGLDAFKMNLLGFQAQDIVTHAWSSENFKRGIAQKSITLTRPEIIEDNELYDKVMTPYLLRTYENLRDKGFTLTSK